VTRSATSRQTPYPPNDRAYCRRNPVDRLFRRPKTGEALPNERDHPARNHLGGLALAGHREKVGRRTPLPNSPSFGGSHHFVGER
jgi:hypothetical protein